MAFRKFSCRPEYGIFLRALKKCLGINNVSVFSTPVLPAGLTGANASPRSCCLAAVHEDRTGHMHNACFPNLWRTGRGWGGQRDPVSLWLYHSCSIPRPKLSEHSIGVSVCSMPLGTVGPQAGGQGSVEKQPDFPKWGYKLVPLFPLGGSGALAQTHCRGQTQRPTPAADQAVGVLAAGSLLVPPGADPSLPESCQRGWH